MQQHQQHHDPNTKSLEAKLARIIILHYRYVLRIHSPSFFPLVCFLVIDSEDSSSFFPLVCFLVIDSEDSSSDPDDDKSNSTDLTVFWIPTGHDSFESKDSAPFEGADPLLSLKGDSELSASAFLT
eukprot:scaffold74652_cov22-Cyclotella_meneghiniana.AAC.1